MPQSCGVLYIIMRHLQSIFLFDLVVILHAIFCENDRHFRLDWRYIFFGNFFKIIFVATFSPCGTVGIEKGFVQ